MNLTLATQQQFGYVSCDFWKNDNGDIFMTREQIGSALEYADPIRAISKLHERHLERLDKFSVVTKLTTTDGKAYDTTVYSAKGIYEICRWSKQPKADDFYDWVYEFLEKIRKGELKVVQADHKLPTSYKEALVALLEQVEQKEQLELENKMYQQQVADMKPKVTYVDEVLKCTDLLTTTQIADDYGMSAIAFNRLLHEQGIQYKTNGQWLLYGKYKGQGYTKSETTPYRRSDGSEGVNLLTKWTQKGRLFLYETLKVKGILPTMEQMKLSVIDGKRMA